MPKTFQIGTVSNAQRVGKRILAFLLALILGLSSSQAIASPVTIKYKTYFSATFANSYKLKKTIEEVYFDNLVITIDNEVETR